MVEFRGLGEPWVGNFEFGLGGLEDCAPHPDGSRAIVLSAGDLWIVDVDTRTAKRVLQSVFAKLEVQSPVGWIFDFCGLAFARLGPDGILWHTRRLSWDGFDRLTLVGNELQGYAWSALDDSWHPFRVDLRSGHSVGGSFGEGDCEGWEQIGEDDGELPPGPAAPE